MREGVFFVIDMFKYIKETIIEYINNRKLIYKMAIERIVLSTIRATGGVMWIYVHDMIYYVVYICVRLLLFGQKKTYGISGIEFLMTGLVPWLMISEALNQSTNIIRSNKQVITNMNFPVVTLPGMAVISTLIKKLPTFIVVFILTGYYGHLKNFTLDLFIYMYFATFAFLLGYTLFFSAVNAISEDCRQLYMSIMRISIFTVPVLWNMTRVENSKYMILKYIIKANPLVYLVEGYRDAFVFGMRQSMWYTMYFWIVCICLFGVGCFFQQKLKRYYCDFL